MAYEPGFDDPLLIPPSGVARPDWTLDDLILAVSQAHGGRFAVVQFRGFGRASTLGSTGRASRFEESMNYLSEHGDKILLLMDLTQYVESSPIPSDPMAVIRRRVEDTGRPRWTR